jgi:stage IV sporulation protein FB
MAFPAQSDWLRWCIPAGRISGVRVGIHWTFPLFILLYTLNARAKVDGHWALVVFSALVLLYGIVLAHEFGHVFAARREGVHAEYVMIWPLGGLAQLGEDRMGAAEVRIAAAGPAVNLCFAVLLLPVLAIAGVTINFALFSPLDWSYYGFTPSFLRDVLYVLYKANLIGLLFNLIPAFPIDGGRILRGLLYPRHGMVKSILLTTSISFVLVGVFIIWGFFSQSFTLVLIAAFVALNAWQVRRQVQGFAAVNGESEGFAGYDFSQGQTSLDRGEQKADRARRKKEQKERKMARRKVREEREIEEQVDSLLEKISREGMESLTRQERAFLEKASRRKK